jgi:NAD(P) transhydrogenase subunit alpha
MLAIQIILVVAVVFGTLNVVGGFVVTDRMLGMFKGKKPAPEPGSRRPSEQAPAKADAATDGQPR